MRIKSMTATFGNLNHAHLELGEGMNLIYAPNEGGKSTWCAFWRAMLYGIKTRDQDKKGYLADKNRYQPWSGAPMEGELVLDWQGREIVIRRGPKGNTPFGSFSALYTATQEPVPNFTGDTCGELLTGVGREVFQRSAFIGGGGDLAITSAPELERRIAALISSGEEDVSFSQTQGRLREWLNRRRVNRSVGLIPKLEGELAQVDESLAALEGLTAQLSQLEGEHAQLLEQERALCAQEQLHHRIAQKEQNRRYAQAIEELQQAQAQLSTLEGESVKYGALPDKELLKRAQGELQYLKVLEDEIRLGEQALVQAQADDAQAQRAAQSPHFQNLSWEQAATQVQRDLTQYELARDSAQSKALSAKLFPFLGLVFLLGAGVWGLMGEGISLPSALYTGGAVLVLTLLISMVHRTGMKQWQQRGTKVLEHYGITQPEELEYLLQDYHLHCQQGQQAAQHAKAVGDTLTDRLTRRENSKADLLAFVHGFAPAVSDLFGCSAALSRALNLDYELALARERVAQRAQRKEELFVQGGQPMDTLELLQPPAQPLDQILEELVQVRAQLTQATKALHHADGRQRAMGDPAALCAQREQLVGELAQRAQEHEAISLALAALTQANERMQERFSPELNRLAGQYMTQLTAGQYRHITLNRELEGGAARAGDVLPHSALYLSRGTADQLYLAVRLAVCQLCLPQKPPLVLDDAMASFDDGRLGMALTLLTQLAKQQQVLLFTCQLREGAALSDAVQLRRLHLSAPTAPS